MTFPKIGTSSTPVNNRPNSFTNGGASGSYGFDGNGKRVKKTEGGATIYYVYSTYIGDAVMEVSSAGVQRAYVSGGRGQMVALRSTDGNFYWIHKDHLGSGRKMTNNSGNLTYRAEFDPYGKLLYEWSSSGQSNLNTKKFTGYERDAGSGLDYAQARMYSSEWGRFMSPDPMGLGAATKTSPKSLNRYSFVSGNPVNFRDPGGTCLIYWSQVSETYGFWDSTLCNAEPERPNPDTTSPPQARSTCGFNLNLFTGEDGNGNTPSGLSDSQVNDFKSAIQKFFGDLGISTIFDSPNIYDYSHQVNLQGNGPSDRTGDLGRTYGGTSFIYVARNADPANFKEADAKIMASWLEHVEKNTPFDSLHNNKELSRFVAGITIHEVLSHWLLQGVEGFPGSGHTSSGITQGPEKYRGKPIDPNIFKLDDEWAGKLQNKLGCD